MPTVQETNRRAKRSLHRECGQRIEESAASAASLRLALREVGALLDPGAHRVTASCPCWSTADLPEGHEIRRNPAGARAFCDCPEGAVGALWSDTIGRDRCAATTNPGMEDSEF